MKRYWQWIACAIIVTAATTLASAQTLGDVARQERTKQKPQASKTITNDDLTSADTAQAAPSGDSKKDDAAETKAEDKNSAEDKVKQMQEWKARIAAQDSKVKDLDREINLMEREHKLRVAVFYADAGARIRDERAWADAERKYQADMGAKQKALGAERTKLDDLREAARKSGVGGLE